MTPWTVAFQAPFSIGFSRQEYWSGLPCPPPGDLPNPGSNLPLLLWQAVSSPLSYLGSPRGRDTWKKDGDIETEYLESFMMCKLFALLFIKPLVAQMVKCLPTMWETPVQSLGSLEKAMAPHSSTLAWKIPWTEEPGRLQSMGPQRVGHD